MLEVVSPRALLLTGVVAAVLAGLMLALMRWGRWRGRQASQAHLERALAGRRSDGEPELEALEAGRGRWAGLLEALLGWLDLGLGRALVADEDRQLLDRCGYGHRRHRALYLGVRLGLPLLLVGVALLVPNALPPAKRMALYFAAGVLGVLLPKWWLRLRAGRRLAQALEETPLLVDLLRLLQGTGMSLDQALQVVADEFRSVLPVLGRELAIANRQFAAGRSRADSLRRLGQTYHDDDLATLVSLLCQIDRHGGAVQEPLRQFGQRLREKRRASLRELVGKLNVKMTGVMVLTLLPALLIVVAGPGFLAVVRALGRG